MNKIDKTVFKDDNTSIEKNIFATSCITFIGLSCSSLMYFSHFISIQTAISKGLQVIAFLAWGNMFFSGMQLALCSSYLFLHTQKQYLQKIVLHANMIILGLINTLTVLDLKLFTIMGNHVYDAFIIQSVTNANVNKEIHFGVSTIASLYIFVLVAFAAPYGIFALVKKLKIRLTFKRMVLYAAIIPIISMLFIAFNRPALSCMSSKLPLVDKVGILNYQYVAADLDIDKLSQQSKLEQYEDFKFAASSVSKPDILFIVIESLRSDMMTKELMPTLYSLSDTLSTIQSKAHFSSSHVTERSIFSLLYGIHSFNYEAFSDKQISSLAIRMLKAYNYVVKGVSASGLSDWHSSDFMLKQFDIYKEFTQGPPDNDDRLIVDYLKTNLRSYNSEKPVFQFVFLNSTHHNYCYPASFEFYKPVMPLDYNHFLGDKKLEKDKFKIVNRYKNSVRYVDYIINQIMFIYRTQLEQKKLIIVITGDHAEEFWDKGFLGHGAPDLYNCRTSTPLIFYLPNRERKKIPFTSHTEIFPTIIDYINTDQYKVMLPYFNAQSLIKPIPPDSHSILISAGSFRKNHKLCLINSTGKYWLKAYKDNQYISITKQMTMDDVEKKNTKIDSLTSRQIVNDYTTIFEY